MKVAVSAPDRFVAPYILDMLGDAAVEIPPEAMEDQMTLDALLTSCNAIVHINSKPTDTTFGRDDRNIASNAGNQDLFLMQWIVTENYT